MAKATINPAPAIVQRCVSASSLGASSICRGRRRALSRDASQAGEDSPARGKHQA
jgi:hypothetical protein